MSKTVQQIQIETNKGGMITLKANYFLNLITAI